MEYKIFDNLPQEAKYIRTAVFIDEQGFKNEFDEIDDTAKHILIYHDGKAVGVARFFSKDGKEYHIGRVAVLKPYRKYGYGKEMCEKNAASEGVADRCRFQHGDANKLDFPDESFDAVVSNYVYHNITGSDKRALLMESLRVLKKGGVFALNDDMKPHMYGDMDAFAQELRDMGYEDVQLIDTAKEAFGSHIRAAAMMLGKSMMIVGRK